MVITLLWETKQLMSDAVMPIRILPQIPQIRFAHAQGGPP